MAGNFYAFEEFMASAKINAHIDGNSSGLAEAYYKTLQANDVFNNNDGSAADEFVDSTGTNDTVSVPVSLTTTDSTSQSTSYPTLSSSVYTLGANDEAPGDTTHDPDSFTNVSNAFDGDPTTNAQKVTASSTSATHSLGKTFASKFVDYILVGTAIRRNGSNSWNSASIKIQTYNGSTWSDETTLHSTTSKRYMAAYGFYRMSKTVQGIRIQYTYSDDASIGCDFDLYQLEYGDSLVTDGVFNTDQYELLDDGGGFVTSGKVVCAEDNILATDGTEQGLSVYIESTIEANTSITMDITDGTVTLSGITFDSRGKSGVQDVSSFTTGNLQITFNLNSTNVANSPRLKGYGVHMF